MLLGRFHGVAELGPAPGVLQQLLLHLPEKPFHRLVNHRPDNTSLSAAAASPGVDGHQLPAAGRLLAGVDVWTETRSCLQKSEGDLVFITGCVHRLGIYP